MGINNDAPIDVTANLKRTANGLERVRQHLNSNAIRISSGYRSPALERVLCDSAYRDWCKRRGRIVDVASWNEYLSGKQHPSGKAVDFVTPYGNPVQVVRAIAKSGIDFDQLILEMPDSSNGGWTHISFSDDPRRQVLVIDRMGTRSFT